MTGGGGTTNPPAAPGPRPPRRRRGKLLIFLAVLFLVVGWLALTSGRVVHPGTVLVLDLEEELPERSAEGLSQLLAAPPVDFLEVAAALRAAARDPRIEGLLIRVKAGSVGPGKVDELRGAIERFRLAGKFAVALANGPDTLAYYLATAADEVLLDRSTTLDAVGIRLSAFFLRDGLARLGVELDLVRVGDFKGTYETLALPGPTPEFEEAMNSLADSIYQSIVSGVAAARKLDEATVRALLDRCPLTPEEAVAEKLADRLVQGDEVLRRLEEKAAKEVHLASIRDYIEASRAGSGSREIAVVHVLGTIIEGDSRVLPLAGESTGADTAVKALREAAEKPSVDAILLRIDSPGGVVSASEKIYHAVNEARKRKPVVASMGGAAASGGYYAACAAEKIFAHPTTFTGSIGVFGGKVVASELLATAKVEARSYPRGRRAGMSDPTRRYTDEERRALKDLLEDVYRRFVSRVAAGRGRSFEEIHAVAQGRVWTGSGAVAAGLVDATGGMGEAIEALRGLARIPAEDSVELVPYPPRATLWDILRRRPAGELAASGAGAAAWMEDVHASLRGLGLLDGAAARLALLPFSLQVR